MTMPVDGCRASADADVLIVGTVRIPPTVALLVTERAVPAAENVVAPVNVLATTPDCVYPPDVEIRSAAVVGDKVVPVRDQ